MDREARPNPLSEQAPESSARGSIERSVVSSQVGASIVRVLGDLPDEQREVFLMREIANLPFDDIALITQVPAETVKARMRYALDRLRDALSNFEEYARALRQRLRGLREIRPNHDGFSVRGARSADLGSGRSAHGALHALSRHRQQAARHARRRTAAAGRSTRRPRAQGVGGREARAPRPRSVSDFGRGVSVLASYAMRPQLAMALLLLLVIASSLILLRVSTRGADELVRDRARRARERDRERRDRSAPRGRSCARAGGRTPRARERAQRTRRRRVSANRRGDAGASATRARTAVGRGIDRSRLRGRARRLPRSPLRRRAAPLRGPGNARRQLGCLRCALCRTIRPRARRLPHRRAALRADLPAFLETQPGFESAWQAAGCYRTLGDFERARHHYEVLLKKPGYADRAQAALASMGDTDPLELAKQKEEAAQNPRRPRRRRSPTWGRRRRNGRSRRGGEAQQEDRKTGKDLGLGLRFDFTRRSRPATCKNPLPELPVFLLPENARRRSATILRPQLLSELRTYAIVWTRSTSRSRDSSVSSMKRMPMPGFGLSESMRTGFTHCT